MLDTSCVRLVRSTSGTAAPVLAPDRALDADPAEDTR